MSRNIRWIDQRRRVILVVMPVLMILGSCVSLQFGAALAIGIAFPALGAAGVTTLRLGLAAILLLMMARPRAWRWSVGQWRSVVAFGVALAGMNGTFYEAIARLPLGVAVSIEFLGPLILAAVLSRRRTDLVWVGLALAAMVLLGVESMTEAANLDPLGVLFALIAGAFWALYILTSARVGQRVPGSGGLAMALAVATVCVLPFGMEGLTTGHIDTTVALAALGTALLSSVIPYTLELGALRRLPRHVFGVLLSLEPIVATIAGWVLLGQAAGALRLTAIVLVIIASIGTTVGDKRARITHDDQPETDPLEGPESLTEHDHADQCGPHRVDARQSPEQMRGNPPQRSQVGHVRHDRRQHAAQSRESQRGDGGPVGGQPTDGDGHPHARGDEAGQGAALYSGHQTAHRAIEQDVTRP